MRKFEMFETRDGRYEVVRVYNDPVFDDIQVFKGDYEECKRVMRELNSEKYEA